MMTGRINDCGFDNMLDGHLLVCEVSFLYPAGLPPFLFVAQNDGVIVSPRTLGHCLLQ